jgi:hypothetical protein
MTTTFDPQVGDRCAWRIYTDVEPCTVVARTAKTVTVRIDTAEATKAPEMIPGGFAAVVTELAEWAISENPNGRLLTFSLRKGGNWKLQGTSSRETGNCLYAGWRKFYDYGF